MAIWTRAASETSTGVATRSLNERPPRAAWRPLYRLGGAGALAIVALVAIQMAVFLIWPPPTTARGYFTAFHDNALVGLLNQDLLLIVDQILLIVVTLALYVALRRTSEAYMAIALALGLVGIAVFLTSNTAFNMLALSDQYAAATTDEQRSMLLAAGAATLAGYQGTAFVVGYLLTGAADLIIALVMLRSPAFGRAAAVVGIVYGVMALVPPVPSLGSVGLGLSLASLLPMVVWLVMIARGLFRLNRAHESGGDM